MRQEQPFRQENFLQVVQCWI